MPAPAVDLRASILLVEDEPHLREDLRAFLVTEGFRVFVAGAAEEALALWAGSGRLLDLLLADVRLPGLSGLDLWHHLASGRPTLPVLLISGHAERELREIGALEEGVPFLPKPFRPQALATKVRALLARA